MIEEPRDVPSEVAAAGVRERLLRWLGPEHVTEVAERPMVGGVLAHGADLGRSHCSR